MESLFKNHSLSCLVISLYVLLIGITQELAFAVDLIFLGLFLFSVYSDYKFRKISFNKVNIIPGLIPIGMIMISYFFNFDAEIFFNMLTLFTFMLFIVKIKYNDQEYHLINGILVALLAVYIIISLYGYAIHLEFENMPFINSEGFLYTAGMTLFIIISLFKTFNALILGYRVNTRCDVLIIVTSAFIILGGLRQGYYNCTSFVISFAFLISYFNTQIKKKVVFICSSGGHLDEMLQLKPLFDKYDFHIVTETGKSTKGLKKTYPKKVDYLMFGSRFNMKKYLLVVIYNTLKTIYLYYKIKPTVVITTGAHTAVPMCLYGKLCGAKVIFIESFANLSTKTLSGRIVYPIADKFIVQWESTKELYPKAIVGGSIY